jgi:hypothetical protein
MFSRRNRYGIGLVALPQFVVKQCCGSGMITPHPNFFHPGSRIRIKNLDIVTQKIVSKLSEIGSGWFIPDPDPDFLPIPDPGSRVTGSWIPDPEPQHCCQAI